MTSAASEADTAQLRTVLVSAIWHERAARIIVDLGARSVLDDLAIGALVAATALAVDQHLHLTVQCASPTLADELTAAGVRQVESVPAA